MQFDFLAPSKIVFGWGRRSELGPLTRVLGERAFLVFGSRTLERAGTIGRLAEGLEAAGVAVAHSLYIGREPEVVDVDEAAAVVLESGPKTGDVMVGIGGGAALDFAKAIAAMATNAHGDSVADFLEGVGRGLKLEQTPLPVVAVPTTAGTGSEATKNAVISSREPPFKKSLRDERLVPAVALIDPELTASNSTATTAHSGMDALTQLIESYVSCRAQPLPQAMALRGLQGLPAALRTAVREPENRQAREVASLAALLSGVALANSGLGLAHGVAAALGCHIGTPHGLACAVMLAPTLRFNADAIGDQCPAMFSAMFGGPALSPASALSRLVGEIQLLADDLGIPRRLRELGVKVDSLPQLAAASRGNSLSGNPKPVSDAQLVELLESLW